MSEPEPVEVDWVDRRIDSALNAKPVPAPAAAELKKVLRGPMQERQLSAGDLGKIARTLLGLLSDQPK